MQIGPSVQDIYLKLLTHLNDGELVRLIMFFPSYTANLSFLNIGCLSHSMRYVLSGNVKIIMTFGRYEGKGVYVRKI